MTHGAPRSPTCSGGVVGFRTPDKAWTTDRQRDAQGAAPTCQTEGQPGNGQMTKETPRRRLSSYGLRSSRDLHPWRVMFGSDVLSSISGAFLPWNITVGQFQAPGCHWNQHRFGPLWCRWCLVRLSRLVGEQCNPTLTGLTVSMNNDNNTDNGQTAAANGHKADMVLSGGTGFGDDRSQKAG